MGAVGILYGIVGAGSRTAGNTVVKVAFAVGAALRSRRNGLALETTTSMLVLSFLIGVVAGLRAMTAPAAAALSARLGWIDVSSTPLAFMGDRWTVWILGLMALVELVTDQLPATPSRTVPVQFGTRLLTGALAGATLGVGSHALILGAVLGLAGAAAGTLGGAAARSTLAARFGRDLPAALLEDLVAVGGAILLAAAA